MLSLCLRTLNRMLRNRNSRCASHLRCTSRRKLISRLNGVQQLEDRRLLTISTPVLGTSNDVVFNGDDGADIFTLSVSSEGLLQHSPRGAFNSLVDLDLMTPGDQVRAISDITSFTYNDSGMNDNFFFGGANALSFGSAHVTVNAGSISLNSGISLASGDGAISLIAARSIVLNSLSSVTTIDGGIALSANASGTAGGDFDGLKVDNASIRTTGSGDISLIGVGGNNAGVNGLGISLRPGTTVISTGTGPSAGTIEIDGTGGDGTSTDIGVSLWGSLSSVDGDISIIGKGGRGTGGSNRGVFLSTNAAITSTGTGANAATITIDGTGGAGTTGIDGVELNPSTYITSVDGAIAIRGRVGDGRGSGVKLLGTSISSTGTGANAATITIQGAGGNGTTNNYGLEMRQNSVVTSVDGAISLIGQGGTGLSAWGYGVYLADFGAISSTGTGPDAATITIDGTGGVEDYIYGASINQGVVFIGSNSEMISLITSVDGDIAIIGRAGAGSGSPIGVSLSSYNRILSTGTGANAAQITIDGTSTKGTGVLISGFDVDVATVDGDISITGHGKSGVDIGDGVASTGAGPDAGSITILGTGTTAYGISISSETIASLDGNITVSGQIENGVAGVLVSGSIQVTTGALTVNGSSAAGDGSGVVLYGGDLLSVGPGAIQVTAGGVGANPGLKAERNIIGGTTATGNIEIETDSVDFFDRVAIQSSGALTIRPRTASTSIGIGGGVGELNLDDTEINNLVDGFSSITIGDATLGTGVVDIDSAVFSDPLIIAGGVIHDHLGADISAGTNSITFIGAVAPGQSPGVLRVTGDFEFANHDTFQVEIGGIAAGETTTNHDQLNVAGTVTIGADVTLNLSSFNGFTPSEDQQFEIIHNDGGDAVSGTFAGLPEGALIVNFLGSGLNARISYLGLDAATGNDVVIRVNDNAEPAANAGGPYTVSEGSTVGLDGSGSSDPDQVAASLLYEWDFDFDGNSFQVDAIGATPTFDAAGIDGTAEGTNRTIALRVTDDGELSSLDTATVTITNAPPTLTVFGPGDAVRGQTVYLSGSVQDLGVADTQLVTIDWGDGSAETPLLTDGGFSVNHIFTTEGIYAVVVHAIDDDGGEASNSQSVIVTIVAMQGGDLAVGGTTLDDHILFTPGSAPGEIQVALNGESLGTFQPSGRLLAFGQAGDDNIQVAGSIDVSAWLYGDAGDDRLKGGAGHDLLFGGNGDDLLAGQSGRDLLIGGLGADRIIGNGDDDILIAGYTAFDFDANRRLTVAHQQFFVDIQAEWISDRSYASRRANLRGDADNLQYSQRLNGTAFLRASGTAANVFDDSAQDILTGSSGQDWMFAYIGDIGVQDKLTDLSASEFADALDWIMSE